MPGKILEGPKLKYTAHSTLGQFFFTTAKKLGDKICQSYFSVKQRSTRVALELQKRGITSKDVIVFCSAATLDNVIPLLACFYLGAKAASLDPRLSSRQTTHLLTLVSPSVIFVEESSVNLIEESLKDANFKPEIVVFGETDKYSSFSDFVNLQENEEYFEPVEVDIQDTALMFFSSGTTGLPKAICHSHYSFLLVSHSLYQSDFTGDVILFFTSFYWISGMTLFTCSFIAEGCRIYCRKLVAENTFKIIEKYKVTCLFLAPILTHKLTSFADHQNYDTSSLYSILSGGTPMNPAQFKKLSAIFKHTNIVFSFGLTETGLATSYNPKTDNKFIKTKIGSSGKPSAGFSIKVVDLETNEILGPNQKGEICIKGPTLMKGYYNANASDTFDEDGFLKSGDIGFYDEDECFYIIERMKEMFKYMSWHIVPSSIEAVLLEHPAVDEAVVFGIPRNEEEGEVPAACVVLKKNSNVSEDEIKKFIAARVSDNEKLRGGVTFATKLLKTPTGKLMRKDIKNSIISSL